MVIIQNVARLSEDQSYFKDSVVYAARTTMLGNVGQDSQFSGPKKVPPLGNVSHHQFILTGLGVSYWTTSSFLYLILLVLAERTPFVALIFLFLLMASSVVGTHGMPRGHPALDCPSTPPMDLPHEDQVRACSAVLWAVNKIRQVLGSGLEEP